MENINKFALIIGINYKFLHKSRQLNGCVYDAMRIKNMFVNSLGFSNDNIETLTDEKENLPTHQRIKKSMNDLKSRLLRTQDELWIYYYYEIPIMKLSEKISHEFCPKQFGKQQVIQTPLLSSSSRIPDWIIKRKK